MRNKFIETLTNLRKNNDKIFLFSGDLGFKVLDKYITTFPDSYINVGISEQNMIQVASGYASQGNVSYTYSIGNFTTLRVLEFIRNSAVYHLLNLKIVALGAGFAYGQLGFTHHLTEDISCLASLPKMTIFSPADPIETEIVTIMSSELYGPCYIRLGKGGEETIHQRNFKYKLGYPIEIIKGESIAIFSTGSITNEALIACNFLREKNINIGLYSFPTIKPINKEEIQKLFLDYDVIFTLEEHNIFGGFGSIINTEFIEYNQTNKKIIQIYNLAVNDSLSKVVGSQAYLRKLFGLDSQSLIKKISAALGNLKF